MRLPRAFTRAIARGKARVPPQAWPLLLTLRSVAADGPFVADPALRRPLILAAHPDDETLGCAGTIAILRRGGAEVTVAFATDGEATRGSPLAPPEVAARRRAEAIKACGALGVDDVRFAGLPDGHLPAHIESLTSFVSGIVEALHPDGILLPWFLDGHEDHAAISAAVVGVASLGSDVELWGYETWTPLPANRLVDITRVLPQKQAAIAAHVTASLAFDLEAALGLNRWRSIHGLMGRGYGEAFLVLPAPSWLALRQLALRELAHPADGLPVP